MEICLFKSVSIQRPQFKDRNGDTAASEENSESNSDHCFVSFVFLIALFILVFFIGS